MIDNKQITDLAPQEVWKHFYALTQIPRPSKKEEKAVAFILDFAKQHKLEAFCDKVGNVIVRKPAYPGKEQHKGIILQTHLDMVPQKNSDKVFNFDTDPIEAYIDGEWVTANGTTLGADNGMGVAASLAILASKTIQHGPVEALFTIDEETGMTGAFGLEPNKLKGDILINLDSEDEGELYVGCAGGLDGTFSFSYKTESIPANYQAFKIAITGLKGGHSGMDIVLGRGNANKMIFAFLKQVQHQFDIRLSDIQGGSVRNAIPREAFAVVCVPKEKETALQQLCSEFKLSVEAVFHHAEPNFQISVTSTSAESVMDLACQTNLTDAIAACPNGVIRMSDTVEGLVETSSNLAIVKSKDGEVKVACLMRSSIDAAKNDLQQSMESVFRLAGAQVQFTGGYPGWAPNPTSDILTLMEKVYFEMYGKKPAVKAIHAGLECGLLGGVYPNWDMISCGPTIRYPHSPDEKVKIDTVDLWWKFLTKTIEMI